MSHYFWSVPAMILMYSGYAFTIYKNNLDKTLMWFILSWLVGAIPLWSLVSLNSNNLLFDGFVYDFCIIISYVATLLILGAGSGFSILQCLGILLSILGILLIKCG